MSGKVFSCRRKAQIDAGYPRWCKCNARSSRSKEGPRDTVKAVSKKN